MLQDLRDKTQGTGFKILVGVIIFVLAVFGFGGFNLFGGAESTIASVNGEPISQTAVLSEAERERRRLLANMGENFDPSAIDPAQLQGRVIERLISKELLHQSAQNLGLAAAPASIRSAVNDNENFQVDGEFNEQAFTNIVENMGFTPATYVQDLEMLLPLGQLQNGITQTSVVLDWELNQTTAFLSQKRDLAYLSFEPAAFVDSVNVSDDDIEVYYQENESQFMTQETLSIDYVDLGWDALINDESISFSEEQLRELYDQEKTAADETELRDSSHILVQVGADRSDTEALELVTDIRKRASAGEEFAKLADTYSDDPGSAKQGGSLGSMQKGTFVSEFEDALWALENAGDLSVPVKTQFGYHLIQLDGVSTKSLPPFEDYQETLEQGLRETQARELFAERVSELDVIAISEPSSLDEIVESFGLAVTRIDAITENAGTGPFNYAHVREAAFGADVLEEGFNSAAIEFGDSHALVMRVVDRTPRQLQSLADVTEAIKETLSGQAATARADELFTVALAQAKAGESTSKIASQAGVAWETKPGQRRGETDLPAEIAQAAFGLPAPAEGKKSVGEAQFTSGARAVVTVTQVEDGDVSRLSDSEVEGIRRYLENRAAELDFASFYQSLEGEADIRRPQLN